MNWFYIIGVVALFLYAARTEITVKFGSKKPIPPTDLSLAQKQMYNEMVAVCHRYYRKNILAEQITPLLKQVLVRYYKEGAMTGQQLNEVVDCMGRVAKQHNHKLVKFVPIE